MSDHTNPSAEELKKVTDILAQLKPGVLPIDLFHAVTRLVATPIIELVPLRRGTTGNPEILLLRRDTTDPVWSGQWHVPGTVVRASDAAGSFQDAFDRIAKELGTADLESPLFVKNILHHSGRGMEVSQIYWAELSQDNNAHGQFFPADHLPKDLVQSQLDFIPDAIAHYIHHSKQ